MKRLIAILAAIVLVMCSLSSCRIEGYDKGHDDGYDAGYDYGYTKGIEEAQQFLAIVVDDDLSSLGWDIEDQYGLHPEDALMILSNYADVPDEVDKEDLNAAIWAIYRYYHESNKIINSIDDYVIE